MSEQDKKTDISVVIPVTERADDLIKIYELFHPEFLKISPNIEYLFVFDFKFSYQFNKLNQFKKQNKLDQIRLIRFGRDFGEALALNAAFEEVRGDYIFTLPSYFQVKPESIHVLYEGIDKDYDVVIGYRQDRHDPRVNKLQSKVFHCLAKRIAKLSYHDLGCGARVLTKEVAGKIVLSGSLQRFLPILAEKEGFHVKEVPVQQSDEDVTLRLRGLDVYLSRIMDIIMLFFLVRFTRKPLRFFGMLGGGFLLLSFLFIGGLLLSKILFATPLGNNLLVFAAFFILVVGVQIISLGLIGEVVIFTHAREVPEYTVQEVVK